MKPKLVIIIKGKPGTGKSLIMRNLKNSLPSMFNLSISSDDIECFEEGGVRTGKKAVTIICTTKGAPND